VGIDLWKVDDLVGITRVYAHLLFLSSFKLFSVEFFSVEILTPVRIFYEYDSK